MRVLFMVVCLGVASVSFAKDDKDKDAIPSVSADQFDAQRKAILEGFRDGEKYAETSRGDREKVLEALDRMQSNFGTAGSVNELDQTKKVAVFNDQELINSILADARKESRMVCKHERKVGTRMKTSQCDTVAGWERRREKSLRYNERTVSPVSGPGG